MIIPLGGGGSKVVASIVVTYPAGSTCTCTLGSKVLTAKDTSGKWVFGLPTTGSWVVKATKGSQSTSKTISITAEGQSTIVTLAYEFYLFNKGKVPGIDWEVVNLKQDYATVSIGTTIQGSTTGAGGDTNQGWSVSSTTKINITGYTKLCANVTSITPNGLFLGIDVSKKVKASDYSNLQAYSLITQKGKVSVDISSIESGYIGLGRNWWQMNASQLTVDQIWLE